MLCLSCVYFSVQINYELVHQRDEIPSSMGQAFKISPAETWKHPQTTVSKAQNTNIPSIAYMVGVLKRIVCPPNVCSEALTPM